MAVKKRKRIKKTTIIIAVLAMLVTIVSLLIFTNTSFWFKHSIHDNANRYSTRHCLVFYPDSENGKKVAKQMCDGVKDDRIYDYSLIPFGDYYLVSYGEGHEYFVDKDFKDIAVNEVSDFGKKIISDYLRYSVKVNDPDKYYNSKFMEDTYVDNLDFSNVEYDIVGDTLKCHFPEFETDVLVPLKYIQPEINMNFGYANELYVKPTYIDSKHTVICLTFDDGPQLWYGPDESSSVKIVDTLYKYDATATFYVVGDALEERDEWTDYEVTEFLTKSVNNGNEYGSHTQEHNELINYSSSEEIKNYINGPVDFMKDTVGYTMATYRPPGGLYDETVKKAQPLPAIFWDVDSRDWASRDADEIYEEVLLKSFDDGDVIIFHDIYDDTAKAIEKLVPELVNRGYQLVTISEMLKNANIDVNSLHYYYNLNPYPYYE